ncbi:argininosuccinate lyase [Coraliomargarita sinensis]|uniref:Argininosuccinate lyase n=1 Tax=Coraliomargarita sinensis TaxID=2174842 RepID=A0A317ZMX8_9BACT|nr:argininosuccinate lyase [Coraliomargarita sinensis]PXA05189.1 argininosuccinate lyase [Coraliomargarita sinensis]
MSKAKKQATWGGRFSEGAADLMVRIGESVSFDHRLAPFDVQGSKAQAGMLAHVGLITRDECQAIQSGLDEILSRIEAGVFEWDPALEDVHMNIEQALTAEVPAAAKLHTARSRNDQVATDMRLWFKSASSEIENSLAAVIAALVDLADKTSEVIIPGYTHLQRAQPVSMAHHLLAYVEMFDRDRTAIAGVKKQANVCPLGSGAIAGTTLPIDREFVARELGFVDAGGEPQITQNSMDAVSDRDTFIAFASACATIGVHLSRLSEDFILWSSAEFGFVRLPDAFTTGSSLMPQKKNPDAFELIRGKSARLNGNLQMLLTMVKGLPLTYNRDLQEDKPPVFDCFDQVTLMLDTVAACLPGVKAQPESCAAAVADPLLLATDVVDYLVNKGVPFRKAHHVVGALVSLSEKLDVPLNELPFEEARQVHEALEEDWTNVFNLQQALAAREKPGMPGPEQVAARIAYWRKQASK